MCCLLLFSAFRGVLLSRPAKCCPCLLASCLAAPTQVHILLDTLTLTGCLQRVKECAFAAAAAGGRGGKASKAAAAKASQAATAAGDLNDDEDDDDGDDDERPSKAPARGAAQQAAASLDVSLCLCVEALTNLAVLVEQVPLRSSREVLQAALEGVMELLGCSKALATPPGAKSLKLVTTGAGTRACGGGGMWSQETGKQPAGPLHEARERRSAAWQPPHHPPYRCA